MNDYIIYTDGAYSSKRDQGGIGIIILKNNQVIQMFSKSYHKTTNNRMELIAVLIALKSVRKNINSLTIYTDSMYVIGCATLDWKRKKNRGLWGLFDEAFKVCQNLVNEPIKFIHIKGHNGDKYNEMCDKLAVEASQEHGN